MIISQARFQESITATCDILDRVQIGEIDPATGGIYFMAR